MLTNNKSEFTLATKQINPHLCQRIKRFLEWIKG